MKRFLKHLILFVGLARFTGQLEAQDFKSLEARIISLENRLRVIEAKNGSPSAAEPAAIVSNTPVVQSAEAQTYVIREGDTIGGVARKFEISRQALLEANNLSNGQPIYVGETLIIPAVPSQAGAAAAPGLVHVVQTGDTLIGIARRYNAQVDGIRAANNLKGDVIGTGQQLVIPGGSGTPQARDQKPSAPDSGNPLFRSDETYGKYTVEAGDNLYALARDFFTTLPELQRLNKLGTSTVIQTGQVLIVPTSKYDAYHKPASVEQARSGNTP